MDDSLAGLVTVVSLACLTWSDWGIVNELQKVLAVSCNDCKLLAVLAESVELVGECSPQLLTCDVAELGFSDKGLSLSTNKLLLEDNDLWAVWLLVLELSDLISDLLLA